MSTPARKPTKRVNKRFTPIEDMLIWKHMLFGNQKQNKSGRNLNGWRQCIETTGLKRSTSSLDTRFRDKLCPHLPLTLFHTETKLNFCIRYKIKVEMEFLKVLEKDAHVIVDDEFRVVEYTMKPTAKPNLDHLLSDKDLLKFSSPIDINKDEFTEEEDEMIWEYAIKNRRDYKPGSVAFWEGLNRKFNGVRSKSALSHRFMYFLAPNLHKKKFGTKIKLKLCKTYKIFLDPEYMKKLKRRYNVRVDKTGRVRDFKEKPKVAEGGADVADETLPVEDDPQMHEYVAQQAANMRPIDVENHRELKMADDSDVSDDEMHQDDTLQSSAILESDTDEPEREELGSNESGSGERTESGLSDLSLLDDSMELDDHFGVTSGSSSSRFEPPELGGLSDEEDEVASEPRNASSEMKQSKLPMNKPKEEYESDDDTDDDSFVDDANNSRNSAILDSDAGEQEREEPELNESESGEGLSESGKEPESQKFSSSGFDDPDSMESENPAELDDQVAKSSSQEDQSGRHKVATPRPKQILKAPTVAETPRSSGSRFDQMEAETVPKPTIVSSEMLQSKPPMKKPKMEYASDDDTDEEPIVDGENGFEGLSESGNSGSSGFEDPDSMEFENPMEQDDQSAKTSRQQDQSGQHTVAIPRSTQILNTHRGVPEQEIQDELEELDEEYESDDDTDDDLLKIEDDSDVSDDEMHQDDVAQSPETLENTDKRRRGGSGAEKIMELDDRVVETTRSSSRRSDQQTGKAVRQIRETPAANPDPTLNDTRNSAIGEDLEDVAPQRPETPENNAGEQEQEREDAESGVSGDPEEPEPVEVGNSEDPTNSSVVELVRGANSTESTEIDYRSKPPEAEMEVVRQGKLEMSSDSGNEDEELDVKPKVAPEPRRLSPREAIDRALNDPIENVKMESETDRFSSPRNRNPKNPHDTNDIGEPAAKRSRIRSYSESSHRRPNEILKLEAGSGDHNDQEQEPANLQEIQNTDDVQLQELENRIVGKLTDVINTTMTTKSAKITESIHNCQNETLNVSKRVDTLADEIRDIRQPAPVENEAPATVNKKEFLQNLRSFLSTIPSSIRPPELVDGLRKLDVDIENSPDGDLESIEMKLIASSGETMRLAVSRQE